MNLSNIYAQLDSNSTFSQDEKRFTVSCLCGSVIMNENKCKEKHVNTQKHIDYMRSLDPECLSNEEKKKSINRLEKFIKKHKQIIVKLKKRINTASELLELADEDEADELFNDDDSDDDYEREYQQNIIIKSNADIEKCTLQIEIATSQLNNIKAVY